MFMYLHVQHLTFAASGNTAKKVVLWLGSLTEHVIEEKHCLKKDTVRSLTWNLSGHADEERHCRERLCVCARVCARACVCVWLICMQKPAVPATAVTEEEEQMACVEMLWSARSPLLPGPNYRPFRQLQELNGGVPGLKPPLFDSQRHWHLHQPSGSSHKVPWRWSVGGWQTGGGIGVIRASHSEKACIKPCMENGAHTWSKGIILNQWVIYWLPFTSTLMRVIKPSERKTQ